MGEVAQAVVDQTLVNPMTSLLFGFILGIAVGIGGMFWFRRKGVKINFGREEDEKPPV